ncbi:DUF4260 domain-containing protein [Devosia sp. J2-20]|uniref:DUF4260 domain-containing protein n=1 Tax=Devosia sp. J2-20 TaxID=3026161 RepID=UPI00249BF1CD|nr:DUF4260 domain-containing protein [Devosia sp. J2-20]WDQ99859.1 DUF4260 domain-containing protein [Devosia sp. J2-20]
MENQITPSFVLWQRAEGALVLIAALVVFWHIDSGLVWWSAVLLFFAPDLSFAAYGLGRGVGAAIYNLVHVYAFGLLLLAAGQVLAMPLLAGLGALWLAHSGFDRALGYGLKSAGSFSNTHLGRIGRHR